MTTRDYILVGIIGTAALLCSFSRWAVWCGVLPCSHACYWCGKSLETK